MRDTREQMGCNVAGHQGVRVGCKGWEARYKGSQRGSSGAQCRGQGGVRKSNSTPQDGTSESAHHEFPHDKRSPRGHKA